MTEPASHITEAQKLTADGIVELMQIDLLPSGTVFFKNDDQVVWQGNTYEQMAFELSGVGNSADDEASRPQLTIVNPEGIFSSFVDQGALERATVTRKKVLRSDIDADNNIFSSQAWMVSRVVNLSDQNIVLELRDQTDGPNFMVPARVFAPPEFPVVSLQ